MSATRREAVQSLAAMGLAAAANAATPIPRRKLGKTGIEVSILGLGGARLGMLDDGKVAREVIRRCYEMGVNYFDCAAAGAYGLSQSRYGAALRDVRDKVVFGTKTRHRSMTQAQLDLDQSLSNLGTDYLDLYQIHNVINDEDVEFIFGPKGVMEMVEKAKKAGKIRHVGFTGHTVPSVLNRMIESYPFETILLPLSAVDGSNAQKSFERETLPLARSRGMGVIAMKVLSAGQTLRQNAATLEECLRYVWSLPGVSTAIMGMNELPQVDANVALARAAKPMTAGEMDALRRRLAAADSASLEPWKANRYDSPDGVVYRAD